MDKKAEEKEYTLKAWHLILGFIVICLLANNDSPKLQDSKLSGRMDILESRISAIEPKINSLTNSVNDLISKSYSMPNDFALLSSDSPNYTTIKTANGLLYIALVEVTKYANGYILKLKIGNPNFATFPGAKMTINYGDINHIANIRTKEEDLSMPIYGGKWNFISVKIAPAKEEDLSFLSIKVTTPSVLLY